MKIKIRDLSLECTSEMYVPLDAVIELQNGEKICLTESNEGLVINCQQQATVVLQAANSFVIKRNESNNGSR